MNIEKYTDRVRGFIQSAQSLAMREGHQQFSTLHILKVLLDDPACVAERQLLRAGATVSPVPLPLDELLMAVAA